MFAEAAEGLEGEEARHAMGGAYIKAISEQPERLMMQMQMYLAVAAAEEEGDREFGEAVRTGWMRLWDTVHLPLGADAGRDDDLHGPGHAHQLPGGHGLPGRSPGLGGARTRRRPTADMEGRGCLAFFRTSKVSNQ